MVKITFVIKNLLATYYISGFIAKGANKALHKVSYCGNNDDGFGVGAILIILGLIMFYNILKILVFISLLISSVYAGSGGCAPRKPKPPKRKIISVATDTFLVIFALLSTILDLCIIIFYLLS